MGSGQPQQMGTPLEIRPLYSQFQYQDVGRGGLVGVMESDILGVLQVLKQGSLVGSLFLLLHFLAHKFHSNVFAGSFVDAFLHNREPASVRQKGGRFSKVHQSAGGHLPEYVMVRACVRACVCVCSSMRVCACPCVYVLEHAVCVRVHVCECSSICVCRYMCAQACVCVLATCVYECMCLGMRMHMCVCVWMHVHMLT